MRIMKRVKKKKRRASCPIQRNIEQKIWVKEKHYIARMNRQRGVGKIYTQIFLTSKDIL